MMLRIRLGQLQVMEAAAAINFQQRMVDHVLEIFPDQIDDIRPNDLYQVVGDWITEAFNWDFTMETDVEQYVELCACHDEMRNAKSVPWIVDVLTRPDLSATSKLLL